MAGLTITGYKYALSSSVDNVTFGAYSAYQSATWSSGNSFTITGLTNGTYYKVKILAVNSLGDGAESSPTNAYRPYAAPIVTTTAGADATTTPSTPTTNAPTGTQSFTNIVPQTFTSGSNVTWTNPYPSGAATGTGTLNGSSGTTHFVWGTTSGSYPNEVAATSNAYVKTTWARGTTVYYKAKATNTSCTATFNGTVNSNGDSTTVTFEYGTSSGVYTSSVSAGTVTALTATNVTANVSSLSAGTYYYRTKSVNAAGTSYGTERSITISAKSATAASEQSFTPPYVGTIHDVLVVGGGGGALTSGGGGGGVAASNSMSVATYLTYSVGVGGSQGGTVTTTSAGQPSSLSYSGSWTMSADGGGIYENIPPARGGRCGTASGGTTFNSVANVGGYENYGCVDYAGGGGGGVGGAGQGAYYVSTQYNMILYGGNGGAATTYYGITVSSGGGGKDTYGDDGFQDGSSPTCSYGGGGAQFIRSPQGGVVRFYYYGP